MILFIRSALYSDGLRLHHCALNISLITYQDADAAGKEHPPVVVPVDLCAFLRMVLVVVVLRIVVLRLVLCRVGIRLFVYYDLLRRVFGDIA